MSVTGPGLGPQRHGVAVKSRMALYLPFVLVSFAANSLITRYVVAGHFLDAGLLSAARFVAGALALLALTLVRGERPVIGRANLRPALWLGVYALCISYGYRYIGAAAGTFVFYAAVLITLVAYDVVLRRPVPRRRGLGAFISLTGVGVLAGSSVGTVTVAGVVLLSATGVAWGLYTAAGRGRDPRVATTGNFLVLAAVVAAPALAGAASGLRVTAVGVAWAAGMGVGTTALAYVAWYACQRSLSGTSAGSVQLIIPVLTAIGAVLLLGEHLTVALLLAAVLVGAGMWLGRAELPPPTAAAVSDEAVPLAEAR